MIYHTSWCPYCNYTLEVHNARYHPKIDSEFLPCPKCRKLYKTGRKLWKQMDENERADYYLVEYFKTIVTAFILSLVFSIIVFDSLLKINTNWITFIISCLVVFPLLLLSTKKQLKTEIETTFEDALLRHWKQYYPDCDSLFKETNDYILLKYNCTFFELEKNILPDDIYNTNKYNQIDERIVFLLDVLRNNTKFENKGKDVLDNNTDEQAEFSEEVLNILSDKDRIKNILDGNEEIDESLFLGIENPYNNRVIENLDDIKEYLSSFLEETSNIDN